MLAKAGDTAAVMRLWELTRRLCFRLAGPYRRMLEQAGYAAEDLEQEGFIAFCEAVKAFEPDSGNSFTSYLKFPVQNVMRAALGIYHGESLLPAPLSLDEPISEDGARQRRAVPAADQRQGPHIRAKSAAVACMRNAGDNPGFLWPLPARPPLLSGGGSRKYGAASDAAQTEAGARGLAHSALESISLIRFS